MRRALAIAIVLAAAAVWLIWPAGESEATDEEVIREWVDTLRAGDVEGAAELFALPAVVANGTPPVELATREDAIAFNRALPCGAVLLSTEPTEGGTIGNFELTERPGGDCGAGIGELARTLFLIRDGLIAEWRRVGAPAPAGPIV
jgi:hypothetical protein